MIKTRNSINVKHSRDTNRSVERAQHLQHALYFVMYYDDTINIRDGP
jgi:hypothetical protein